MNYRTILNYFIPKHVPNPLGRWQTVQSIQHMNHKIDWSNEDHCGPCGQYVRVDTTPTKTIHGTPTIKPPKASPLFLK